MLKEAMEDVPEGIYIRFRTDGSVFNLRRLLAHTKTMDAMVIELLFADDCALLAHNEEDLQRTVNHFAEATKAVGLTINLKKTKVLFQKPPSGSYNPAQISIEGAPLNTVEHFTYLGSIISDDATVTTEIINIVKDVPCQIGQYENIFVVIANIVQKI